MRIHFDFLGSMLGVLTCIGCSSNDVGSGPADAGPTATATTATDDAAVPPSVLADLPASTHSAKNMHIARMSHTSTLLQDGRVLVTGGESADEPRTLLDSVESTTQPPTRGASSRRCPDRGRIIPLRC